LSAASQLLLLHKRLAKEKGEAFLASPFLIHFPDLLISTLEEHQQSERSQSTTSLDAGSIGGFDEQRQEREQRQRFY
jgi:hypothetical protein